MKISLNDKQCLKQHLTLQEALIASAASMPGFKTALHNMVARGILNSDASALTSEWGSVINGFLTSNDEHLQQLARQMAECFPKGKKQGTVYYYRCNTKEIVSKLKGFFDAYGEYPDEQILRATRQFVASFHGDYRFLPLIKYFISKNKKVMDENGENHIVEVSELASALENMTDSDDVPEIADSDDWLVNSRN